MQIVPHRQNPLLPRDYPDPGVLRVQEDLYVCAATSQDAPDHFPLLTSKNLDDWEQRGSIFPAGQGHEWARSDFWAPEVHAVDGRYVAYYTARDESGRLCLGAATAPDPLGPYTDLGRPLLRDPEMGLIDATFFRDQDGSQYLIWKEDGNDVGKPTPIKIRRLTPDGLDFEGPDRELIRNDLDWEGALVEAPWMVKRGDQYYLFYSANAFYDERYCVGVARATSPDGPFEKLPRPILHSNEVWAGPGHGSLVTGPDGDDCFVYHSWLRGSEQDGRMLMRDPVHWSEGWPSINDGTPSGGEDLRETARAYRERRC